MIPSIQPIKQQAYTDKGNQYTESNIGKFAAGASIAGGAVLYGSEAAFKGAKKVFNKAKTIEFINLLFFIPNYQRNYSELYKII